MSQSDKIVRTHNHASNRTKNGSGEKKVIFKGVLDNPFRIQWPSVPLNIQKSVLELTVSMMNGVAQYRTENNKRNRKRKRVDQEGSSVKKKTDDIATNASEIDQPAITHHLLNPGSSDEKLFGPTILQHIVVGINEVTKRLESQISSRRLTVVTTAENPVTALPQASLKIILVCRADIDPPLLIDHLPHLVAAYNSIQTGDILKLVPLPKGAEPTLAHAIGLRRAAVIGFDASCPELGTMTPLLDSIPTLVATWLTTTLPRQRLVPTHIKQVRTSAPVDLKAEKERRKKGRAQAKGARKTENT